jgi:hypothetical protein
MDSARWRGTGANYTGAVTSNLYKGKLFVSLPALVSRQKIFELHARFVRLKGEDSLPGASGRLDLISAKSVPGCQVALPDMSGRRFTSCVLIWFLGHSLTCPIVTSSANWRARLPGSCTNRAHGCRIRPTKSSFASIPSTPAPFKPQRQRHGLWKLVARPNETFLYY